MFDTTKPPNGFSTGDFYTAPLRVYYWDFRYWVYDQKGFLCSTSDLIELNLLLQVQAKKPSPDRPHFWPSARNLVYPGYAEEEERKAITLRNIVLPTRPYETAPVLSLGDLGL